jgi:rubrerythrin
MNLRLLSLLKNQEIPSVINTVLLMSLGELPKNTLPIFSESKSSIMLIQSALFPRCTDMSFHKLTVIISARAKVEAYHERRCLKLLAEAEQNHVFKRDTPIRWKYRNCGYVLEGPEANEKWQVCGHSRGYY